MFPLDSPEKERKDKEEAIKLMTKWRQTTNSEDMKKWFNPEEKREIPKPKPIPFRRPKPEVLEETSFSKDLDGGSIYDPLFF